MEWRRPCFLVVAHPQVMVLTLVLGAAVEQSERVFAIILERHLFIDHDSFFA